jgi:hypothetical protein
MAENLATTNDGGVSNLAVGSFTGDGTITNCNCGFKPRYLRLINLTDRTTYEITADMDAGDALKTVAAGTMTEDASNIQLSGSDGTFRGFTIPAAIAITAKEFHYVAFG